MRVELLYFDGCPSHEALLPRLRAIVESSGSDTDIEVRRVESAETATRAEFLGSPTVRVDGRDVDPSAETRTDYGLKCRLYQTPHGLSGLPPDEWIADAIEGAGR